MSLLFLFDKRALNAKLCPSKAVQNLYCRHYHIFFFFYGDVHRDNLEMSIEIIISLVYFSGTTSQNIHLYFLPNDIMWRSKYIYIQTTAHINMLTVDYHEIPMVLARTQLQHFNMIH